MDNYVVIRIKERSFRDNHFEVEVSIRENRDEQEEQRLVTFANPYSEQTERILEWHFERYINRPYDDNQAKEAVLVIEQYGKTLFQQLFTGDLEHRFRLLLQQYRPENIIIEVIGEEPLFQAIYWESLRAPWEAHPLVANGALFLRKNTHGSNIKATVKQSPTINLLIVTARPNEENDVAYRAIQRPLVELLEETEANVRVDILRPGTYEALVRHLDDHAGHYHIIHFDLHGGLLDYKGYKHFHNAVERLPVGNNLYGGYFGLKELSEADFGDSKKSFLFFESEEKGVAVPVEAEQLAALLEHKHIPICVLNACQSAKQEGAGSSTSLGSILVKKGIQLVVAMRYSVSVTAAVVVMEEFYNHLYQQKPPEHCITRGRQLLYRMKQRKALYNYNIELEDWLLPVVYQNGKPDLNLRPYTRQEEEKMVEQQTLPDEVQQHLPYGFIGRDLDILKIEKDLLLRSNILLLQGMGGAGKTTLLKYLCRWWMRTGFVENVFYFGYDERAHTLVEILYCIARRIYPDGEFGQFMTQKQSVQEQNIVRALKNKPYALILDNAESITGEKLAIPNTLPEPERQALKKFLVKLKKGKSRVIIGSRSGEAWLRDGTFDDHVYLLRGLDPESASDFAQCILHGMPQKLEKVLADPHFERLMTLIAGYPLALKAILPHLKRDTTEHTPEKVLMRLGEGNLDLDKGNVQERTESIIKCIEYAHSNLSGEAQQLLLCLAPFQTAVNVTPEFINIYIDELRKEERFQAFPFDKLDMVVHEAVESGFMQEARPGYPIRVMTLQPIFTFFLKNKLEEEGHELLRLLQVAFLGLNKQIGIICDRLLRSSHTKDFWTGLFLMDNEYENLYQSLLKLLEREEPCMDVYTAINTYLHKKQLKDKQLALSKMVCNKIENYSSDKFTPEMDIELVNAKLKLAVIYQEIKKPVEARKVCEDILEFWDAKGDSFKNYSKGPLYHNLGNVFRDLGHFSESNMYHEMAMADYKKEQDIEKQALAFQNLGNVVAAKDDFQAALGYYQKALDIHIQRNDRYRQAWVRISMANAFVERGENQEAYRHIKEAFPILEDFKDENGQALLYEVLGKVLLQERDLEGARKCYEMTLAIYVKLDNVREQGRIYMHLADIVTTDVFSARYYEKAIDILNQYEADNRLILAYCRLGGIRRRMGELAGALDCFSKALLLYKQKEDIYGQGKVYHSLAITALLQHDYQSATDYFQQALVNLLQFPAETDTIGKVLQDIHSFVMKTSNKAFGQAMFEKALPLFEGEEKEVLLKLLDEINQLDSPTQE